MRHHPAVLSALLILGAAPLAAQHLHKLPASPATVAWGYYWSEAKPVLRIASGDTIDVTTMLTNQPNRLEAAGVAPADVEQELRNIVDSVANKGPRGHILTGPVYVEGADSGDVLEVKIVSIDLKIPYGYNGCSGFLRANCDSTSRTRIIPLDAKRMVGQFMPDVEIPLHPFFGSMGVAPPDSMGRINSAPPGIHAGNLDNKDLVAGATLYIPVHVRGALFEVGDGHAAQGNGEVDITALETSLVGTFQLIVRKDLHLTWPRAETPTHIITMGLDINLTAATRLAVREMIAYLVSERRLSREDAYMLTSVAVDVNNTQLVDGTLGVHALLPKAIFVR